MPGEEVAEVIDDWITDPSTQVRRTVRGTITSGLYSDGSSSYFRIDASIRPDSGANLDDDPQGQVVTETRVLYNNEQELWTRTHDTLGAAGHDADIVYLNAVAAELELHSVTPDVDTVIAETTDGPEGDATTFALAAGAVPAAGVLDESHYPAITFTFLAGTTTVAQLEAAIDASTHLAVATPGTPTNVLELGDVLAPTNLAGGDAELWRCVRAKKYRAFWKTWIERVTRP